MIANRPVLRIRGQEVDVAAGQNDTYGGSSETEVTDWQANPSGRVPSWPVITATPVQKCPNTARMVAGSGRSSSEVVVMGLPGGSQRPLQRPTPPGRAQGAVPATGRCHGAPACALLTLDSDRQRFWRKPGLAATSYALLGLLSYEQELSGYDVRKWIGWTMRFYYGSPAYSQIYSELKKLEHLGLVTSRVENTGGARSRRLYKITASGLAEVTRWANEESFDPPSLKHGPLLRMTFGHLSTPRG